MKLIIISLIVIVIATVLGRSIVPRNSMANDTVFLIGLLMALIILVYILGNKQE